MNKNAFEKKIFVRHIRTPRVERIKLKADI